MIRKSKDTPDVGVISERELTRYTETHFGDYATWECEKCDEELIFGDYHPSESGMKFCPNCGRRISEFVDYVEPEEVDD